jgi:hypothetical protein
VDEAQQQKDSSTMMTQNFRTLVQIIRRHFSKQSYVTDEPRLASLFETAFLASTITDEGRNVTCSISVFDPHQTINDGPEIVRTDRWSIMPLADPIPCTPEHLARISQAIRPHAGALGVHPASDGGWSIWAIIDQEHLIRGFRQHKVDQFYPRAGQFQVEIVGPGCIALYHDSVLLARLQRDALIKDFQDIFHEGPLAGALGKLAEVHRSRVVRVLSQWRGPSNNLDHGSRSKTIEVPVESIDLWLDRAKERWLRALSGTLLEMRQLHHGGALLIIPRAVFVDLNVKHRFEYARMDEVLAEQCASDIMAHSLRHFGLDTEDEKQLQLILPELEDAERRSADATRSEVGAIQFIASLSGLDGLVLAVRGMKIRGFGVEILTKQDPKVAYLAMDPFGATGERIDPTRWGTRHRSMMRYCVRHKGSIGFVVCQDGDVRAMMRVVERLLVWPNIDLERIAMLPFEVPCPHCLSVGGLFPVRPVDDGETANSASD